MLQLSARFTYWSIYEFSTLSTSLAIQGLECRNVIVSAQGYFTQSMCRLVWWGLKKNGKLDRHGLEVGYCYCSSWCDAISSLCLANCSSCWSVEDKTRNSSLGCYMSTTKCSIDLSPCNPACTQFFEFMLGPPWLKHTLHGSVEHCGVSLSEQSRVASFGLLRLNSIQAMHVCS